MSISSGYSSGLKVDFIFLVDYFLFYFLAGESSFEFSSVISSISSGTPVIIVFFSFLLLGEAASDSDWSVSFFFDFFFYLGVETSSALSSISSNALSLTLDYGLDIAEVSSSFLFFSAASAFLAAALAFFLFWASAAFNLSISSKTFVSYLISFLVSSDNF